MSQLTKNLSQVKIPWKTILALDLAFTSYLTLSPIPEEQASLLPDWVQGADKLVHFILFMILGFLVKRAFTLHTTFILFAVFLFSFLIEVLQFIMPFGRSFDAMDLLANALGILTGVLIIEPFSRRFI